jgi:hypothetical protein
LGAASEEFASVGVALSDRLAAARGATNQQIAGEVGCNPVTVGKWADTVRGEATGRVDR